MCGLEWCSYESPNQSRHKHRPQNKLNRERGPLIGAAFPISAAKRPIGHGNLGYKTYFAAFTRKNHLWNSRNRKISNNECRILKSFCGSTFEIRYSVFCGAYALGCFQKTGEKACSGICQTAAALRAEQADLPMDSFFPGITEDSCPEPHRLSLKHPSDGTGARPRPKIWMWFCV
jgi:hypothetical protein